MTRTTASLLFGVALALAIPTLAARAAERPSLTIADQPVRILRGASVFKGLVGVPLLADDIIETGAGGAQVELSADLMVALAPETRICLASIGNKATAHSELLLLSGWIKVANKLGPANGHVVISTPLLRIELDNGESIVHQLAGKAEMFAEDGGQTVAAYDERGKPGAPVKLGREQHATGLPGAAPKVLPRPPKSFIAEMPVAFRDPVAAAPDRLKGAKVQAAKEREASYADAGPWLETRIGARKAPVSRFLARLSDPLFRKQLDAQLGQSAEWKHILHPPETASAAPPAPPHSVPTETPDGTRPQP
ncbi:MAG: hypothetical protein V4508_05125 [Pseudomonadota bacterium]